MRNRESAQRSRNQRKNEMVYLQSRVQELEEENKRLREQTPSTASSSSPSGSTSTLRLATPEQKVLSLVGDLGLPPSMVSAGVNLSSVAPQSTEMAVLERITMLESMVKQVVALSDLSGMNAKSPTTKPSFDTLALPQATDVFDFNSFVNPTVDDNSSLPITQSSPTLTTPTWSSTNTNSIHPIACHSAAVATSDLPLSGKGEAQQRAKGTGLNLHPSLITKERLSLVARVVVASAKMRGWTLDGSLAYQTLDRLRSTRTPHSRMIRKLQWSNGSRS
jgi:hypothetical protein